MYLREALTLFLGQQGEMRLTVPDEIISFEWTIMTQRRQMLREVQAECSGVASPKFFLGKYFDFKRVTVFCLGHRLSKYKSTRYARNSGRMAPWLLWIRLWLNAKVTGAYTYSNKTIQCKKAVDTSCAIV